MKKAIGIDLGTYNSTAAFAMGRDNVIMIKSKYGETIYGKNFPSFVLFDYNGKKQMVGKPAKANTSDPKILVWGTKRLVGLSFKEAKSRCEFSRFDYDIEEGPGGGILIKVGDERYTPSNILEFILSEIKADAVNDKLNHPKVGRIENAVISVPAYFDTTRTSLIKEAATNVGFKEVKTIAEPTAAAISYGLKNPDEKADDIKVIAFDIGAGTLDVTIMRLLYKGDDIIPGEVCTSGEEALGGIDIDKIFTEYIINKYNLQIGEGDQKLTLIAEVEKTKIRLSTHRIAHLDLPNQQTVNLNRNELEDILKSKNTSDKGAKCKNISDKDNKSFLEKCRGPVRVALEKAKKQADISAEDLDHVLLVGGPVHMPCIRAAVKDELEKQGAKKSLLKEFDNFEKERLNILNPMECVARGASLRAGDIVKTVIMTDPNGYGTTIDDKGGGVPMFHKIIPPDSNPPITRIGNIKINDRDTLHVTVPLIRKRVEENEKIKYYNLGYYDFFLKATGREPEIEITMELDDDRDLSTTFVHKQTSESIRFIKLNELEGKDIILQEYVYKKDKGRKKTTEEIIDIGPPKITWTKEKLKRSVHAARKIIDDFAEDSKNDKVISKKEELIELIENKLNPDQHTDRVLNRTRELLHFLYLAKVISIDDYNYYSQEIREIPYR